jgi:DNA-binding LytR/AlgR family response regulator
VQTITYYRDRKEFFLEPEQILFFESADDKTYAHTREHIYRVKLRLYVLDAMLPLEFIRVSKSALANTSRILSFATLVGTTGVVEFKDSHKRLHISRAFIKALRSALRQRGKE